jgi:DnaJ-class molecular chaperone
MPYPHTQYSHQAAPSRQKTKRREPQFSLNWYRVLRITPDCSDVDVRRAYLKMAQKWHPDRFPQNDKTAVHRFQMIAHAYRVLQTAPQRTAYNNYLVKKRQHARQMAIRANDNSGALKILAKKQTVAAMKRTAANNNKKMSATISALKEIFWPLRSLEATNNGTTNAQKKAISHV